MKKNILSADEARDSLLTEMTEGIEALPVFSQKLKIEADLATLDEMAAAKKLDAIDVENRLTALREVLVDTDPERLPELSRARVLLIAEQAEVTGLLEDLEARKEEINKDKVKIQLALSDQARAIVEQIKRRETEEVTLQVTAVEDRLQVWQNTVSKVRSQYFRDIGFEMVVVLESIRFFAPLVKKSLTMEPVR